MSEETILKTKKTDILSVDPRTLYVKEGFNVRVDMGDLDSLSESIASIGQLVPLKVSKDRGLERYRVIDGHRRFEAIKLAIKNGHSIPYVKVELFTGNGEDELFAMIVTGTGQKSLNEVEQAEGVKRLVSMGYTPEELSKKIGKSIPYVYNLIKISNLPKFVKDEIVLGNISGGTVVHIQKSVTDESELIKQVKKTISNATKDGSVKKMATAKHIDKDVKKLNDTEKLKTVYQKLINDGFNGIQLDILEMVLFKTKELSVDELHTEILGLTK